MHVYVWCMCTLTHLVYDERTDAYVFTFVCVWVDGSTTTCIG